MTTGTIKIGSIKREVPFVEMELLNKTYSIPTHNAIASTLLGIFRRSHESYTGADKIVLHDEDQVWYFLNRLAEVSTDGKKVVELIDIGAIDAKTFVENWTVGENLGK